MPGRVERKSEPVMCVKCNGKGAPLLVPGDPTTGHDLNKTCDACNGDGYVIEQRVE